MSTNSKTLEHLDLDVLKSHLCFSRPNQQLMEKILQTKKPSRGKLSLTMSWHHHLSGHPSPPSQEGRSQSSKGSHQTWNGPQYCKVTLSTLIAYDERGRPSNTNRHSLLRFFFRFKDKSSNIVIVYILICIDMKNYNNLWCPLWWWKIPYNSMLWKMLWLGVLLHNTFKGANDFFRRTKENNLFFKQKFCFPNY